MSTRSRSTSSAETGLDVIEVPRSACTVCGAVPLQRIASARKSLASSESSRGEGADHEHRFPDYATSMACRGQAEVEAESIAYLVTADAGLDTASYSVPYLASWSGGDIDLLRESMSRVISVARAIAPAADRSDTEPRAPLSAPLTLSAFATASPLDASAVSLIVDDG